MAGIGALGIVLVVLQAGVGYGVYRTLTAGTRAVATICGIIAAGLGLVSLVVAGLLLTLVLDFVILFSATLAGGRFERRPTAR